MTNREADCPECGCVDVVQEILVVGAEERSLHNGDVVGSHPQDYCEEVGVAECKCVDCGHEWTVDRENRIVGKELYVGRIACPEGSKWNDVYLGTSHDAVIEKIADYARDHWQGEEPLPEDDDEYAIELYFGEVDDERYEPLRADTEDYDIIRLPIEEVGRD